MFWYRKGVYMSREDLEVFGFTARCPGLMTRERISGQSSREVNEPNKDEHGGRTNRCANNKNNNARWTTERKTDVEHGEDPEREDEKWMRTEGNKRRRGRNLGEDNCTKESERGIGGGGSE